MTATEERPMLAGPLRAALTGLPPQTPVPILVLVDGRPVPASSVRVELVIDRPAAVRD